MPWRPETAESPGYTVWLTGLSGAGKTTVANRLADLIEQRTGRRPEVLDGDEIRAQLSAGLGFSREDRAINIRRIGWVCGLLTRNGVPNVVAAISPYRDVREEVRASVTRFVEVFVDCPLAVCERRDVKGLYQQARAGAITGFTGIDDPYEAPVRPDLTLRTDLETVDHGAERVLHLLRARGHVADVRRPSAAVA